jgi:hypothetical protein
MNYIWTKERSRINVGVSETISAVRTNTELLWEVLSGKLAVNPGPLKRYILQEYSAPSQ